MIYEDRIAFLENNISKRIKNIEWHQAKVNYWFKVDNSEFVQIQIREHERLQRASKVFIDKYREEIRQLKQLQRDAA